MADTTWKARSISEWERIPPHMQSAITRYLEHGVNPGGFVTAVLENNLSEAVCRADDTNSTLLREYIMVMTWMLPAHAWGSRSRVEAWTSHKGLDGGLSDA